MIRFVSMERMIYCSKYTNYKICNNEAFISENLLISNLHLEASAKGNKIKHFQLHFTLVLWQ